MIRRLFQKFAAKNKQPGLSDTPETLPRWNLEALYSGLQGKDFSEEQARIEELSQSFEYDYEGKVADLSGAELGAAIKRYEEIETLRQKINAYIILLESDHVGNFAKTGPVKKWQETSGDIVGFFESEIVAMKEKDLMTKMMAPELAVYGPWLASLRDYSSKPLPDAVDGLSVDYANVNMTAWLRFYQEAMSDLRVTVSGKEMSVDAAHNIAADTALPPDRRRAARNALGETLKKNGETFALVYNTIIKDGLIDSDLRGYTRADQETHMHNAIDTAVVDTMFDTVKASYSRLSHRFFAWKAAQGGKTVLAREDVFARLPGDPETVKFGFTEAKRLVLRAFRKFSPKFGRLAQRFFDEKRLDAGIREGKDPGGFALSTAPGLLPYIMVNFTGSTDDVVVLGHELGHGVHQYLCEKNCGLFRSGVSTPVAETASIFAEMLVFDELLRQEKDPAAKRKLLVGKIDSMLGNGLQQLAYHDFERRVHEERRTGEIGFERISDIWLETQKQYWGSAVETDIYDRYYWMVVPHFFNTPFYVYSYAFAQQMVSGLYEAYKDAERQGTAAKEDFVGKYIGLLETGNTKSLRDMMRPFGLDPEKPAFWENGLALVEKYLDELAKIDRPAPTAAPNAPASPAANQNSPFKQLRRKQAPK